MKLAAHTRYAARILVELARNRRERLLSASRLAQITEVSVQFAEQILKVLKRKGITVSARGVSGGHALARSADNISLGEVVRLMEGGIRLAPCVGLNAMDCQRKRSCVMRRIWSRIAAKVEQEMDVISLATLLQWEQIGNKPLEPSAECRLASQRQTSASFRLCRRPLSRPGRIQRLRNVDRSRKKEPESA